jgi:hypothetical protein
MPRIASFSSAALYDTRQCRPSFVALLPRSTNIELVANKAEDQNAVLCVGACPPLPFQPPPTDIYLAITRTWIIHHNTIRSVQAMRHLIRQGQPRYDREANAARFHLLAKSVGD